MIPAKYNDEWVNNRLGNYPRDFLLNLPVSCHGCEYAYLLAEDLVEPEYQPEVETWFLDLGLVCPLVPAEVFETFKSYSQHRKIPTTPYRYKEVDSQLQLFQLATDLEVQLQLFEAEPWGTWSEWEETIVIPIWFCVSDGANGYLCDLLECGDEVEEGSCGQDPYIHQYEEFLTEIKAEPNGCRWYENYRK